MGLNQINTPVVLRPTITYLFSYLWLAGELVLFTYVLFLFELNLIVSFVFFALFARFYYWLNFSPETLIQSIFLLVFIPMFLFFKYLGINFLLIEFSFVFSGAMLLFGALRLLVTRYVIHESSFSKRIFYDLDYDLDQSRELVVEQHSRGRVLNFGAILMPVKLKKKLKYTNFWKLFFGQRNVQINVVRLDGIKNPHDRLKQLKSNEEQR